MNNQPILEIDEDGTVRWCWYLNGYLHRVDGPAVICPNNYKKWCLYGQLHREDGPAIEYEGGYKEWWLNDEIFSRKEEWFKRLTPEQQYNYLWNLDE
jgi:hypothetical protein